MTITSSFGPIAKSGYVASMRRVARVADRSGLSGWLARRHDRGRGYHWASSLLSIYDIDGLVALDVPWWTYDAIAEVDAFLSARPARVFEYGSGASTVWAARRAASVTSVEHDGSWHGLVTAKLAEIEGLCPVDLRHVPVAETAPSDPIYLSQKSGAKGLNFEDYATEIDRAEGPFDLIVIDGRVRQACLRHAEAHLAPGGIIVFDNSHRARYRAAIATSDMTARVLRGLTPSLPYPDETTLMSARDATAR